MTSDLQPDQIVHADGTVSDTELYEGMLDNPEANEIADRLAMHCAVELGFTVEEALEMFGRKSTQKPSGKA